MTAGAEIQAGRREQEPAGAALRWVLVLVVFLASVGPFLPALSQGFVDLDDDRNFLLNESYRGLGAENLRWMFTESYMGHYQPLSWVTLALDYKLFGLDGAGYHATNALFHGLGMVALYFLALALLRPFFPSLSDGRLRLAAAAAALVHAMHPLRVESVAWATERRDVQSGLFLILTVLTYVAWARRSERRTPLLALSLTLFVLSLLSKAWGITLPAVLLAMDVWPLRRLERGASWGELLREKVIYAVPAAVVAWLAAAAQGAAAARDSLENHTIVERCVQASYGLFFYLWKTLWPSDLAALYWLEMDVDPALPVHLLSYVVVAGVTAVLFVNRRRFPAGLAAWVSYAIVVSPVLGFLQSGFQKVADRYTYLACIPFALLFGAGLASLARHRARFGPAFAGALVLLGALGALSWKQTLTWKDSETLYEHIVAVEPGNYFAWHNLAVQYHRQGRYEEAVEAELESIEHHPGMGNFPARENLINLLRMLGRHDEVLQAWYDAAQAIPESARARHQVGVALLQQGRDQDAGAWLEQAFHLDNKDVEIAIDFARVLGRTGRLAEARELLTQVLGVAPNNPRAQAALRALDAGQRP